MGCCCSGIGAAAERQFGEKRATKDLANYRTKGHGSTSRLLLAGIAKVGQPNGRLLDIGSGVGALTFELVKLGLTEAIGIDQQKWPSIDRHGRSRAFVIGHSMNKHLVAAISEKRLIEFAYKGGRARVVEPHDYGIRGGVEKLLGFQISGQSASSAPHGWKEFDLDRIQQLRVLERRFAGSRADNRQRHRTWDTLFIRVT
jgi:hypothetical protein